jgi:hypothetical protein
MMLIKKSESRLVATFGPKGLEFIAPTYKQYVEGARLSPKPEPVVTSRDCRDFRDSRDCRGKS